MAAPIVLALLPIDFRRAGPALRRAEDDHRPGRALDVAVVARLGPNLFDFRDHRVQHAGQLLMDVLRVAAFDEIGLVAHALEELLQLVLRDAGQEARVGDLVAVQMQDRQHATVASRIEKLVAMPTRGQRPCFRFAVSHDAGDDQIRIVERGAVSMAQRVAQFAAFMDAARRLRRNVARNAARKTELLEQPSHPLFVLADVWIDLAVGAFEIGVGDQRRAAVARADDVDHVQVILLDDPIEMHAEHVEARRRAPMAEQPRLDVLALERLFQQRIVEQINLADRQVVQGPPIGIQLVQFHSGKWSFRRRLSIAAGIRFGFVVAVDIGLLLVNGRKESGAKALL